MVLAAGENITVIQLFYTLHNSHSILKRMNEKQ